MSKFLDNPDRMAIAISNIISEMMERIMTKVLQTDPFVPEKHHAAKPLYAALVPDEIFKGSHFERRFVTPFGSAWERLAVVVAKEFHGNCERGKLVEGNIKSERLRRIQETLNKLEHKNRKNENKVKPDWIVELAYILDGDGDEIVPVSVMCDLFVDSQSVEKVYAFELKAPLPNSDQTKVSKEKMFKLLAMEQCPVDEAYYALPYNPYGEKDNYAWSFPMRWFDMKNDPCVLIGSEFWDLMGGKGSYEVFISSVNALGLEYRERIYSEYLGIEPPEHSKPTVLK